MPTSHRHKVELLRATRWIGSALLILAACKDSQDAAGKGSVAPAPGGAGTGSAHVGAAPANTDAGASPIDAAVAAACVPGGALRAATGSDGKQLRICSHDKKACVEVDPATGVLHNAAYADIAVPALASAKVETREGQLVACFADKCREIGKNARDVINRDPDVHNEHLAATTDLRALVIPKVSAQLWDISGDHEIKLRPPSGEQGIDEMRPVGNHIYAVWMPPAEAMYTRGGKLVASLWSDGTQLAMLDETRSVALTPDHRLLVFADPSQTVELAPSVGYDDWVKETGALAVLADHTVAVVLVRPAEASVILVDPARGTVFRRWPLTRCPG